MFCPTELVWEVNCPPALLICISSLSPPIPQLCQHNCLCGFAVKQIWKYLRRKYFKYFNLDCFRNLFIVQPGKTVQWYSCKRGQELLKLALLPGMRDDTHLDANQFYSNVNFLGRWPSSPYLDPCLCPAAQCFISFERQQSPRC